MIPMIFKAYFNDKINITPMMMEMHWKFMKSNKLKDLE